MYIYIVICTLPHVRVRRSIYVMSISCNDRAQGHRGLAYWEKGPVLRLVVGKAIVVDRLISIGGWATSYGNRFLNGVETVLEG